jgi:hypothetical protein
MHLRIILYLLSLWFSYIKFDKKIYDHVIENFNNKFYMFYFPNYCYS